MAALIGKPPISSIEYLPIKNLSGKYPSVEYPAIEYPFELTSAAATTRVKMAAIIAP